MTGGVLSPHARAEAVARLARERVDVLVVGGGITGVGCALDAASRGLSVGLVEARDLAVGTSSRSSKLIHGGLRYLEMLEFGLVREALRERRLLLTRLAPHLVRPVEFLFPLKHRGWERPYIGAGLLLYDTWAGRHLPRARHLSHRSALAAAPALRPDSLVGAVQFHDAQEDDALFAVYVARTAVAHGASIATRARAVDFLRDETGRILGVRAEDSLAGRLLRDPRSTHDRRRRGRHRRAARARHRSRAELPATLEGRPPDRPALVDPDAIGPLHAHGEERLPCDPLGLGLLAPGRYRHRVGRRGRPARGQPERHRVPARQGQQRPGEAGGAVADPRRVRGPAPARRGGGRRRHDEALARAPAVLAPSRADRDRRRQVHDLPRDGAGRGRCSFPGPRVDGPVGHGTAAAPGRGDAVGELRSHPAPPRRLRRGGAPARRGRPGAGGPAPRRRSVHRGRGRPRGHAPGRARPRRHPLPAHPRVDRSSRPRPRCSRAHRAARRAGAGVVRRTLRGGDRALHGDCGTPRRQARPRRTTPPRRRPTGPSWTARPGRRARRRAEGGAPPRSAPVAARRRRSAASGR